MDRRRRTVTASFHGGVWTQRDARTETLALLSGAKGGRTKIQHALNMKTEGEWHPETVYGFIESESIVRAERLITGAASSEPWDLVRMRSGSSRCTESQLEEPGLEQPNASHCISYATLGGGACRVALLFNVELAPIELVLTGQ
ncbi:hypothetical protein VTL71DRAFT_15185 [Oculimacula yallundae]|uniref:Uncharacterized protein n=1 Tax=Oculimacula yallundae TaxID=86028 RepID=A0ABR4CGK9_9HELO